MIVWRDGKEVARWAGNAATANHVCIDPSNRFVAMSSRNRITSLDLDTGRHRDLGAGSAVTPGWQPSQFVIARGKKLHAIDADSGAPLRTG